MLRNPATTPAGVLCPICHTPIESERTLQAGRFTYHRVCWRPNAEPPEDFT